MSKNKNSYNIYKDYEEHFKTYVKNNDLRSAYNLARKDPATVKQIAEKEIKKLKKIQILERSIINNIIEEAEKELHKKKYGGRIWVSTEKDTWNMH